MTDDLSSLYNFHRWANERMIAACKALTHEQFIEIEPFEVGWPSIRSVVVHLAGVDDVWARRFLGEIPTKWITEVDLPTIDDAAALLFSAHNRFVHEILPMYSGDKLLKPWTYTNLKNETFTAPPWAVLRHVVNHGSYHRGQIASKLKRRGATPPGTDMVLWAIENTPQNQL